MVLTLARAIDAKDKYTRGHSLRVSEYAAALADALDWENARKNALMREALLHDIGKIGVPDTVLNKPGRLNVEEYSVIKSHTTVGSNILNEIEDMTETADVALYHHERYDGSGYPTGRSGKNIPENARIISIADAFDAMYSDRVYRKALPVPDIIADMESQRGRQFDPELLDVFLGLVKNGSVLENGRHYRT
jgi:putative nucleotidyltransferase with HDIG domain